VKILTNTIVRIFYAGSLCIAVFLSSCNKSSEVAISPIRAFYYWKQEFKLSPPEKDVIDHLGITKLYVKFFDVSRSVNEAMPVAEISFDSASITKNIEYVPVVFITEATLAATAETEIDTLASHIISKIFRMADRVNIQPKEIQLDCDWSKRIREKYFRLVAVIRKLASDKGAITSATIRLHQVKYRDETGVPPCERGMLMFYNMSEWRNAGTKNSIFDPDEAEKYIHYVKDYPLALDVVLPIFRWSIVYRNNKFLTILGGLDKTSLSGNSVFREDGKRFIVSRDTFAFNVQLREGDMIRPESCDEHELQQWSLRIQGLLPNTYRTFALYHLDSAVLSYYKNEELENIFPH